MTKSTITREQAELRAFITGFLTDPTHDKQSANSLTAKVFRIALAAMDSEPVTQDEREAFEAFMAKRFGDLVDQRRAKNGDYGYMAWDMVVAWTVWQARAAMLQAEPVTTANKLENALAQSPIGHGYRSGCECSGCKTTVRICAELAGNSPVNGVTAGEPLTINLPDISSKAFWSGAGKNETFHPETYRRWTKEAIERGCNIACIDVEVK